ncbi:hypothetical protein SDC9_127010 [bioreactor metagenome]|uniref:ABC transporter substrate-binding protein PnrA-like domain-containing protein n=1 Tax=bioreactor metagenome TaxID=1076179 RepID=A0A645CSR5_9ZZZZ|nr:BMP family protein [Candidatus Pelethousia sp.]
MKKLLTSVLALVLVLSCFTACANQEATQPAATAQKMKVALVLPGKKDDVSFNQAMYRGAMEYAEKHADTVELKVVEGVYDVADIDPTLRDYAEGGYAVIIGHGYQFSEPVNTVAQEYPEVCFLLGCGVGYQANSACYDVQLEAGGYLMGVVAALATQSNKIGVIGGGEGSEITRGHEGFKAGAQSINPSIEIQEVYTGDWNDTTGAYEAAIGMYDSGVDVIWHSGDGIGLGVVQAAEEKDMYVLGNVEDQKTLAPNNVLCGLQYEWGNALDRIFTSINDGTFIADGEKDTFMINVANGGLAMTELNDVKSWLTDEDIATIQDVYAKLGQDAIELPEV